MNGCPEERKGIPEHLRLYWSYKDEISAYNGVLFKSHQVIVPASLRPEMLRKIHKAHQGPESSIGRARESLFWPGMQAAIQETCLACGTCAQYLAERPVEPMLSHDIPSRPWSKISVDLFQLDGKHYLLMVNHYSDYFEVDSLRSVTVSAVIQVMKRNSARHGIPDVCISDNGPRFDSHEYAQFARNYGFNPVKSSPYYSRGNGKTESAVKIAKNILKKSRHEDPYLALLAYRNTPQQGHTYSPAQRLMSRRLRDLIPMATSQLRPQAALPSLIVRDMAGRKQRSKTQYDKRASTTQREFSPGERVFVKPNPQNKHKPWIYGEVVGNPAPRASLVSNPLGPIRRNHSQIRKARTEPTHQYPAEPVDLETISLPGKGDMPADKNQQTDQAVE